jgi:hypothetical protein
MRYLAKRHVATRRNSQPTTSHLTSAVARLQRNLGERTTTADPAASASANPNPATTANSPLPDNSTHTTIELISCLVALSACAYGSEG